MSASAAPAFHRLIPRTASKGGGSGDDTLNAGSTNVTWVYSGASNGFDTFSNGSGVTTALAQAAIYLATAPKSNAVYRAYGAAAESAAQDVAEGIADE